MSEYINKDFILDFLPDFESKYILRHRITKITLKLKNANFEKSSSFKNYLNNHIAIGAKKIIIDLKECKSVDSTFLGALVMVLKKIKKNNGHIVILHSEDFVNSTFYLMNMSRIFKCYSKHNMAVSYLSSVVSTDQPNTHST